jgi:hypothetical protein
MMEPEGWPLDSVAAAALVSRAVSEIDERGEDQSDALLCALLCAAWPERLAQDQ